MADPTETGRPDDAGPAAPRTDEEAVLMDEEIRTMTDTDRDPTTGSVTTGATALAVTDVATGTDRPRRRGPDPLALVVGLATLTMAVFAFVGELPDLGFVDPRWLLAGGAAAVGLLLLVGTLRGRSGGRRGGG